MHIEGASAGVVRGHHIYKLYGLHALMKQCSYKKIPCNKTMNSYAVTNTKGGCIVGQYTKIEIENMLIFMSIKVNNLEPGI